MLNKKPNNQRIGQTIFNFLEWLKANNESDSAQSLRMADPFYIPDINMKKLYNQFLKENNEE